MIVSSFHSPNKSLFVIGGNIIKTISEYQFDAINPKILYRKYNDTYKEISFSYLMFGLDWLFLAGAITLTDSGDVKLCN